MPEEKLTYRQRQIWDLGYNPAGLKEAVDDTDYPGISGWHLNGMAYCSRCKKYNETWDRYATCENCRQKQRDYYQRKKLGLDLQFKHILIHRGNLPLFHQKGD